MRTATICAIDTRRGLFVAVDADYGDYFVFEALGGYDLALGHRLSGDVEALGGVTLRNLDTGESMSLYGQSGPSSKTAALNLLRR